MIELFKLRPVARLTVAVAAVVAFSFTSPAFAQDGAGGTGNGAVTNNNDGDDEGFDEWGLLGLLGLIGLAGLKRRDDDHRRTTTGDTRA